MSDFHHLKVGDKVIVRGSHFSAKDLIGKVIKMTPAKVHVHYGRVASSWFWKKNGKRVGDSTSIYSEWLIEYDPQHDAKIQEAEFRNRFVSNMRRRKWHDVATETMRKIEKLLDAPAQKN